jgi:hypothetical protein
MVFDIQVRSQKALGRKAKHDKVVQFSQTWLDTPNYGRIFMDFFYEPEKDNVWIDFSHPTEVRVVKADTKLSELLRFFFQIGEEEHFDVRTRNVAMEDEELLPDVRVQGEPIKEASLYDIRQALPVYQMEVIV